MGSGFITNMGLGDYLSNLNPSFLDESKRYKTIEIKEIPIMICKDNSICCIPREDEVSSIAVVGASRNGKTLIAHRAIDHIKHLWGDNVAIVYDVNEETYNWSKKMEFKEFNDFNLLLNQNPCALPIVYIYPNTSTLEIKEKILSKINYIRIVLNFDDILKNLGFYIKGVNPEFEIGKAGMYINNLKESLSECNTTQQIKEVLENGLPEEKGFKGMKIKVLTAFDSLFNEEILDITNPEYPSYLQTKINDKLFFSNPFSVIMKAGFIPSFVTSDLSVKKYQSSLMAHYIDTIFRNNLKDFPNEKTWIYLDELWNLCKRDDEPASQALGRVASRGRINNVGLIYVTQYYDRIPSSVKGAKLNFLFSFQTTGDIARKIGQDFDLSRTQKKELTKLKRFECMAMTKNNFVFYRDGERWEDSKAVV